MTRYDHVYSEIGRCCSFAGPGKFLHKLDGPTSLSSDEERWVEMAEESIWPVLYRWHYLRERPIASGPRGPVAMVDREDATFVAALTEANSSPGVLDHGWTVCSAKDGEYLCGKGGIRLRVRACCIHSASPNPQQGETVGVRFPAERRHWMPLYYCTGGGTFGETELRVYFHVKPVRAAWLLERLSRGLLEAGVSYQLKLLNNPTAYTRPDAAVLYTPLSAIDPCRALVKRLAREDARAFRSAIPTLTRFVDPGIGVACEPPFLSSRKRTSFGEHRCRVIARALAHSYAAGSRSAEAAVAMIYREFAQENLDATRPYAGSMSEGAADWF